MRIIAYKTSRRNNKVLIEETGGQSICTNDPSLLLDFLAEPYKDTLKVCWELDSTIALLLSLFGTKVCAKLQATKRGYFPPFSLFYVPGKVFSLTHIPTRNRSQIYELQQYFPDLPDIDNVEELRDLGQKLLYELEKMGMKPTTLTSPVRIYDDCIMKKMDLPQLKDIPIEASEFAYRCSGKLWIEAYQLGYWAESFDYDMISAFPLATREMIDTRDCIWVRSTGFMKDALYGYAKVKVTIHDWVMVSPIIMEVDKGLISPTGTWLTYLTKGEMDFIDKYRIGNYKILDAWWAVPEVKQSELRKPLYTPIAKLLSFKQGTELQSLLAKRISTGVYGKFGEERIEEFGHYFFPCWFTEISTETRLKLAEFLYTFGIGPRAGKGYDSLIHIGVDGVLLSSYLEGYSGSNKWKMSHKSDALVVSSGLVYTRTTRPKGLTLQNILDMVAAHPRKGYYSKPLVRRLTLGDSLSQSRLEDIGKEMIFNSSINLRLQEHDRTFSKVPKTGETLLANKYTSVPICQQALLAEGKEVEE